MLAMGLFHSTMLAGSTHLDWLDDCATWDQTDQEELPSVGDKCSVVQHGLAWTLPREPEHILLQFANGASYTSLFVTRAAAGCSGRHLSRCSGKEPMSPACSRCLTGIQSEGGSYALSEELSR